MPEQPGTYENGEGFQPSEATLLAWQAQAFLLEVANSQPGTEQAAQASKQAKDEFSKLYVLTVEQLRGHAQSVSGGGSDDIDEIMQETYYRAYKYLPGFRGNSQVETWLTTAMIRQVATFYQKRARHTRRELSKGTDPDELLASLAIKQTMHTDVLGESNHLLDQIMGMVNELHPRYRKIILLSSFLNRTHAQIADIYGITEEAAKVRVFRARKKFKEQFPNSKDILED